MEQLFKERKEKLHLFKSLRKKRENERKEVPEGLYTKCPKCKELILTSKLKKNMSVCPHCGNHLKITAYERLEMIYDQGKYKELYKSTQRVNPLEFPGYDEKLEILQQKTGLNEAVVVASGKINGTKVITCVMDSRFLMGSMSSIVGDKITKAIEHATKRKYPLIIFTASGGARMQEGIYSLMQMTKTSAALARHHQAGLLYISYITHPTTGGVTASFASLGDIIIGEPQALIGFAGRRVIESTLKQKLPENFQTTEFMEEQGFKDEFDDLDDLCQHLVVFGNNQPIGTCRFYYDESLKSNVLGRIAVIKEYRGKKVGQYIVKTACSLIQGNVCLHAQLQAKPFYEKLGFKAYGEIDYDEYCPHTWMKKEM